MAPYVKREFDPWTGYNRKQKARLVAMRWRPCLESSRLFSQKARLPRLCRERTQGERYMSKKQQFPQDADIINCVFQRNRRSGNMDGIAIHPVLNIGLTSQEIQLLQWKNGSFEAKEERLENWAIPIALDDNKDAKTF